MARVLTVFFFIVFCGMAEAFEYQGCTVETDATVSYSDGEPVLTFTKSGTLRVSCGMRADVLVVGGGGSGATGRQGRQNWYAGSGGSGGNGSVGAYEMPQGTYSVTVGAGGASVTASGSSNVLGGNAGTSSSIELTTAGGSFAKVTGAGGAGGVSTAYKNKSSPSGTAGNCPATDIAGGSEVRYGVAGAGCTYNSRSKTAVNGAAGATGTGNGGGGGANGGSSGAGGSGVVIVRLKEALIPREAIEVPTAATGLVYDGTVRTGVAAGEHYALGGTYAAKDAGSYEATATPADGYCWPDGTYGAITLAWSVAPRPVTVSVLAASKTVGEEEPVYQTRAEGFVEGDAVEVSWKVWRTNLVEQADGTLGLDERIGTYDLLVGGTARTTNYAIAYANGVGAFEIRSAGPSISEDDGTLDYDPVTKEVVITPEDGVRDVEIVDMPDDATVQVPVSVDTIKGVTPAQVVVVADATNATETVEVDITDAFTIGETAEVVTIELNGDPTAEVEVDIDGTKETVKVRPELTDPGDPAVGPLVVAPEDVEIGVRTIPGLTYHLKRSTTLGGGSEDVSRETAKGTRTRLTDPMAGGRPEQAFYVIEVTK